MPIDLTGFALWLVAFLLSATCHEAGHALVARLGGDSTAYQAGQVSLNPWPHMRREPIGMVLVPVLSFIWYSVQFNTSFMIGWASAPYDPIWAARHPKRAALMAAAGPAANLLLLVLALVAIHLMVLAGVGEAPMQAGYEVLIDPVGDDALLAALTRFVSILAMLNGLLFTLNLMPLPPLDGASVIEGFGGPFAQVMQKVRSVPMAGLIGLIVVWNFFPQFFPYIFRTILFLAHPTTTYG